MLKVEEETFLLSVGKKGEETIPCNHYMSKENIIFTT